MKPTTVDRLVPLSDMKMRSGFDPFALVALAVLTLRQNLRGRRLLVLSVLFLLPVVLAGVLKLFSHPPTPQELEFAFVFTLIPHALAPLTALLYAGGVVQDEVEEQTLTYLLLRPLPRWALYLTKLAMTWLTTSLLTAAFTALTLLVAYWNAPELTSAAFPERVAKIAALMALAQVGYCSLFGLLGLRMRRSLIVGLGYIIAFEGLLANFDAVVRRLTVMYYFRVLSIRWINPNMAKDFSIDLAIAPSAGDCVLAVLTASAAFAVLGAVLMTRREFTMKTAGN